MVYCYSNICSSLIRKIDKNARRSLQFNGTRLVVGVVVVVAVVVVEQARTV
jgi:hypothetical protein